MHCRQTQLRIPDQTPGKGVIYKDTQVLPSIPREAGLLGVHKGASSGKYKEVYAKADKIYKLANIKAW